MTQYELTLPISPTETSGTELANRLSEKIGADYTSHQGDTAPTYADTGMVWAGANDRVNQKTSTGSYIVGNRPITSVADLRAFGIGETDADIICVANGTTFDKYLWDADSTASDDGDTVILPTGHSGDGRWIKQQYSGYFGEDSLSGDLVDGGTISNFASTGILDSCTVQNFEFTDNRLNLSTDDLTSGLRIIDTANNSASAFSTNPRKTVGTSATEIIISGDWVRLAIVYGERTDDTNARFGDIVALHREGAPQVISSRDLSSGGRTADGRTYTTVGVSNYLSMSANSYHVKITTIHSDI